MIAIVPIGHDQLTISRLPFATICLIVLTVAVYIATSDRMDVDIDSSASAVERSQAIASSVPGRFGFVPAHPSLSGLVTHQFLHAGLVHMLLNLFFLWIAAVKMEDLWGRWVFVPAYLVFGAFGAIAHWIAHPGSEIPLVGASGAIAGLMGAFLVRLGRAKINFAYFHWLFTLKPRYGTFEAPAYLMFPLWFGVEVFYGLFFDFGFVAHWSHVGGFAAGVAAVLIMRRARFEERVLGADPEEAADPDSLPLVAFGSTAAGAPGPEPAQPSDDAPPSGRTIRWDLAEATVAGLDEEAIHFEKRGGIPVALRAGQLAAVVAGRVDRVDPSVAAELFKSGAIPSEPAVLIALIEPPMKGPHLTRVPGYIADAATFRYARLPDLPGATSSERFLSLVSLIARRNPGARFAGGAEAVAAGALPAFADLDGFLSAARRVALPETRT